MKFLARFVSAGFRRLAVFRAAVFPALSGKAAACRTACRKFAVCKAGAFFYAGLAPAVLGAAAPAPKTGIPPVSAQQAVAQRMAVQQSVDRQPATSLLSAPAGAASAARKSIVDPSLKTPAPVQQPAASLPSFDIKQSSSESALLVKQAPPSPGGRRPVSEEKASAETSKAESNEDESSHKKLRPPATYPAAMLSNRAPRLQTAEQRTSEQPTTEQLKSERSAAPRSRSREFLSVEIETEGGLTYNPLSKERKRSSLPYLEMFFEYDFSANWRFWTRLEFVSPQQTWDLSLEEAALSFQNSGFPFTFQAGLAPVPLGRQYELLKEFSRPLRLYSLLLKEPTDTGFVAKIPLGKAGRLAVSRFRGYEKRGFDDRFQAPAFAPLIISFETQKSWGDFFSSFLKQDKAFSAPLRAFGAGGAARFPFAAARTESRRRASLQTPPQGRALQRDGTGAKDGGSAGGFERAEEKPGGRGFLQEISFQGEAWAVSEERQTALAFYLFPKLKFADRWEAGLLIEKINSFSPGYKDPEAFSSVYEKALQISWEAAPGVFLIGERFLSRQKGGPWLHKLWAVRLKARLQF